MESITIEITQSDEGGYLYRVWPKGIVDAAKADEDGTDEGDDNGGLCTTTLANAVGMAAISAASMARAANETKRRVLRALDEDGDLIVLDMEDEDECEDALARNDIDTDRVQWMEGKRA